MVEGGGSLSFPQEPVGVLSGAREVAREELEGDSALEPGVLGLVDCPHAPFAQQLEDTVVRYDPVRHAIKGPNSFWRRCPLESYPNPSGGQTQYTHGRAQD